jgi:hypothetical protein
LHQQALNPGVDQAGAELRQIENADDQREQADDVERDDAPRQAGETQDKEKMPRTAQPRAHFAQTARLETRDRFVESVGLGFGACDMGRSVEHLIQVCPVSCRYGATNVILAQAAQVRQVKARAAGTASILFETIADAVQRFDHIKIVVDRLELLA